MKKLITALSLLVLSSVSMAAKIPDFKFICSSSPYYVHIEQFKDFTPLMEVFKNGQTIYRGAPIIEVSGKEIYTFSGSSYDHVLRLDATRMSGTYNRTNSDGMTRQMRCKSLIKSI